MSIATMERVPSLRESHGPALPTVEDLTALLAARDAQLKLAENRAESYRSRTDDLSAAVARAEQRHIADIQRIGETLIEEAEDRSWCGEFDEVISGLNPLLNISLPVRARDFRVAVTVTVYTTVSATDESDADDIAEEVFKEAERRLDQMSGIDTSEWNHSGYEIERND